MGEIPPPPALKLAMCTPGGTQIIFWRSVLPEVWNPYPYLRIFSHSKNGWIDSFFEIFANQDPFLRVFLPQKRLILPFLFANFVKWDPALRIFLTKMGPMSKYFWWKSNPFGCHTPICLNNWVPPHVHMRDHKNKTNPSTTTMVTSYFGHECCKIWGLRIIPITF